jgi:hypothetical protein
VEGEGGQERSPIAEGADRERYPIGRWVRPEAPLDVAARATYIDDIAGLPAVIRLLTARVSDQLLDTPYRTGGWTIRQVVHHLPDSHMNMYIRMKLAITEDAPIIKPYAEERWALLPDGKSAPISMSLDLLDGLHRRWVAFLRTMTTTEFARTYVHPEMGTMAVYEGLTLYAWHGRHHAAHIRQALEIS